MNTMKPSTALPTVRAKRLCAAGLLCLIALAAVSLFVGKYPLRLSELMGGNALQWKVFWNLRFSRTVVGVVGGFTLGVAGFVYQTVLRNPLASPDIIGVSSGASAGAAAGILFFSGAGAVTLCAFGGAMAAIGLALALSGLDRTGRNSTIVLAGIAVHSLAQTALMCLKLIADPERELPAIEYWIMGSLNGISGESIVPGMALCALCCGGLLLLHRQVVLLSAEEGEARMLGVNVGKMRFAVLLCATLAVSAVVSPSGLISFVGLLAPHTARLLMKDNRQGTMALSGLLGGILLCGADILARSVASSELPVSVFTSALGAPFLIYLIFRGRREQ